MILTSTDEYSFDPVQIAAWLSMAGAEVSSVMKIDEQQAATDEKLKVLERFLRIFLRSTQVDEDVIRLRLGNAASPRFFDEVLPALLANGLLEDVQWKGRGNQHRYKLAHQMSEVSEALVNADGSFQAFLAAFNT